MLTMPAFRGLHPTTQALQQPLSSSGQACGSNYSTLLHKKHENHSIMTAVLTDLLFLITRKNESIIMICSLPLLLNHPPIIVEIPAAESVVELETASFKKTFQLLSQRVNMNLPKKPSLQTSDCFHSFVSPDSCLAARRKCQWLSGLGDITRLAPNPLSLATNCWGPRGE